MLTRFTFHVKKFQELTQLFRKCKLLIYFLAFSYHSVVKKSPKKICYFQKFLLKSQKNFTKRKKKKVIIFSFVRFVFQKKKKYHLETTKTTEWTKNGILFKAKNLSPLASRHIYIILIEKNWVKLFAVHVVMLLIICESFEKKMGLISQKLTQKKRQNIWERVRGKK